jgi:hypothetical protein
MNSYKSLYKMLVNQQQQINLLGKMLKVVTKMAVDPTAYNEAINRGISGNNYNERCAIAGEVLEDSLGELGEFHPNYRDTVIALVDQLERKDQ